MYCRRICACRVVYQEVASFFEVVITHLLNYGSGTNLNCGWIVRTRPNLSNGAVYKNKRGACKYQPS